MDPVFATMLDVVRIVTFQPNAADTDTCRVAEEREFRSREAATADQSAPAAARPATREPMRFREWFRFSFMPRL